MRIAPLLLTLPLAVPSAVSAQSLSADEIRQHLFATCFVTPQTGWVVGDLGRIFRTQDGGQTWTRQRSGTKRPLFSISCHDERTAWVSGKGGVILHTADGGLTWSEQDSGTTKHLFEIRFATPERGTAVGDWGIIVHTEDGGEHWNTVSIPKDFEFSDLALDTGVMPGDVILYSLSFPDETHGWIVGEFGAILTTSDGGRSWRQQRAPVQTTLFGVYFRDPAQGWAVGIDSVLLRTRDGGESWERVQTPFSERAYYAIAVSGRYGWTVGSQGALLRSTDGGESWRVQPVPIELAAGWFRAVTLLPGGRGILVGADGMIYVAEQGKARRLTAAAHDRAGG